jgi:hypothetical protein
MNRETSPVCEALCSEDGSDRFRRNVGTDLRDYSLSPNCEVMRLYSGSAVFESR